MHDSWISLVVVWHVIFGAHFILPGGVEVHLESHRVVPSADEAVIRGGLFLSHENARSFRWADMDRPDPSKRWRFFLLKDRILSMPSQSGWTPEEDTRSTDPRSSVNPIWDRGLPPVFLSWIGFTENPS